ncbi:MAG: HflK protein, partial [Pseudomonadota bacterium]
GDAQRFLLVLNEYRNAKDITQRRIYLQTMEEIMGGLNKVLIDSGNGGQQGVLPYLPLDSLRPRPADSDDDSASANR